MTAFTRLVSRSVVLPQTNIDTDQIIPARFLSTTERAGLGQHAFNDWRRLPDGSPNPAFPFNQPENAGRQILLAGRNFGCGSSREHAPWALTDLGLRAIVSSEIADIFRNNSLKNGLVPVVLAEEIVQSLMERPDDELVVDVDAKELRAPDGSVFPFPLDDFARTCLLEGVDELGYLLARQNDIERYEATRHAR
ncbi:3-isopropylmalate dehydratase small subunit [Pseudoxanthomonas putridarboris]|uniref:3-isopropylmalate dehydratase small subunit n=1 Tax=Pseudoxanthomonas putridarboris TaxID=752605 RepID=A0ABU9IVD6_9GAMM